MYIKNPFGFFASYATSYTLLLYVLDSVLAEYECNLALHGSDVAVFHLDTAYLCGRVKDML